MEVPFSGGGRVRLCHPHSHLLARSPFCGFSAWVDSPVVWALPASATESGFLLGANSALLPSAVTTWTNPVLINHLWGSYLSCNICIFHFSGCYCDPWTSHTALVPAIKHFPTQTPPHCANLGASLQLLPPLFLPLVPDSQACHLVAREDTLGRLCLLKSTPKIKMLKVLRKLTKSTWQVQASNKCLLKI